MKRSSTKVRYAVVGLGHIAQVAVLPGFAHARNSRLAALVSGDPQKLRQLGKKYAVERMDVSNSVLMAIQRVMKSAIAASNQENASRTLRELIADCLQRFDTMTSNAAIPYTRDYLTAVILFEASEE